MIDTLSAIVRDVEYSLIDGTICTLETYRGLGPGYIDLITISGPLQHGESYQDFRMRPRTIQYVFGIKGINKVDMISKKDALEALLAPSPYDVILKHVRDDGKVRSIASRVSGDIEFVVTGSSRYIKAGVTLRASDPTFYDPTYVEVTYGVGGGSSAFIVPMPVPFNVGISTLDSTKSITYLGTFREQPVIIIRGPITNPVITNITTGQKIDFTGHALIAGEALTIDTRYGRKTVLDALLANKISWISDDSDLGLYLAHHPEAVGGVNDIKITGTGVNSSTEVFINYYNRYVSL